VPIPAISSAPKKWLAFCQSEVGSSETAQLGRPSFVLASPCGPDWKAAAQYEIFTSKFRRRSRIRQQLSWKFVCWRHFAETYLTLCQIWNDPNIIRPMPSLPMLREGGRARVATRQSGEAELQRELLTDRDINTIEHQHDGLRSIDLSSCLRASLTSWLPCQLGCHSVRGGSFKMSKLR
jgi:hypothetical protein